MAQIVTITNPLTGQPAQVDQLDHNAQQIDDGVARAIGFGLGGQSKFISSSDDLNDAVYDGWYYFDAPPINAPLLDGVNAVGYSSMLVSNRIPSLYVTQEIFCYTSWEAFNCVLRRCRINGEWKPWEWVNPPMIPGIEYRTTERHQGKPVYVQRINFNGALPANGNGQGIINTLPLATTNIIDINVTIKNRTTLEVQRLPSVSASGSVTAICNPLKYGDYDNYAFRITVFTDMSGWDYQACIVKYTKSTD